LETTSPTHPDYNPLKEALNAVNQFLDEVNTSAKEAEMLHTLMDIENRLTGLPEVLPNQTLNHTLSLLFIPECYY
jgi:hypothetical protein